ncbi:lysozyme inhibitor LprI family protein [Cyanobium sp. NIES-981]|uniref:lysozyme inhibitor LprI family protein n=1 Tax=Cyanobium sp. NIES-981 TaxID=1851505 RepID=UPI000B352211|nr:lysozyme inhibitor LprI family protein [Cyanobium sp. NIES-981]
MVQPWPMLLALLAAPLLPLQGVARAAETPCSDAQSTVEATRCLIQVLEAVDRSLETALMGVATEAAGVPSDTFQSLWRDNLTNFYRTSADPKEQAEAFRSERRKVCGYAKSMAFQGTGYGIFTTSCEIELTETLLKQFAP